MKTWYALLLLALPAWAGPRLALDNGLIRRELELEGGVWRTVAFARAAGVEPAAVLEGNLLRPAQPHHRRRPVEHLPVVLQSKADAIFLPGPAVAAGEG